MSEIKTSITLRDNVTPTLNKVVKAIDRLVVAFESFEKTTNKMAAAIEKVANSSARMGKVTKSASATVVAANNATANSTKKVADTTDKLIQKGIRGIFRQTAAFENQTLRMRIAANNKVQSFQKSVERENKIHDQGVQKRLGNTIKESLKMIELKYKTQQFIENLNASELARNEKRVLKEIEAERKKSDSIMNDIQKVSLAYKKSHDERLKLLQAELGATLKTSLAMMNDAMKREAFIQSTLQKGGEAYSKNVHNRLKATLNGTLEEMRLKRNAADFIENVNRNALARTRSIEEKDLQNRLRATLKGTLEMCKLRQNAENFTQNVLEQGAVKNRKRIEREIRDTGALLGKKLKASVAAINAKNREAANFNRVTENMRIKAHNAVNSYIDGIKRRQAADDKATQRALANQSKINNASNMLWSKIKGLGATYFGSQALLGVVNLSDRLTMTTARLNIMNDGLHTTAELQDMIYASAMRSRAGYLDMAESVSKVAMQAGSLFRSGGKQNNAAIVQFMENYNKMAAISGASAQHVAAAMLQITQALSSGELRGDELRSVLENMPVVADYLAKEMGVARDEILGLGHDGKITAEILRNAVLNATDDLNEKMKKIPYTWGQVWTICKNAALKAFEPILRGINAILKSDRFKRFATAVGDAIEYAAGMVKNLWNLLSPVVAWIFDAVAGICSFIKNNWSFIAPIIMGIAAAFVILKSKIALVWLWTKMVTIATKAWAAVQAVFNAIMAMNPVGLVCLAIVALIVLIYLAVAAMNKWCGTNISATGVVAGCFAALAAVVWDCIAYMWNTCASYAEFFINFLNHPIYSVKKLFVDLAVNVIDCFLAMTDGCDEFATNFANAILDAINVVLDGWNWLVDKLGVVGEKMGLGKASKFEHHTSISSEWEDRKASIQALLGDKPANYWEVPRMEYKGVGDWYNKGYNWGEKWSNKIGNFFSGVDFDSLDKTLDSVYPNDLAKALDGGFDGSNLENPALDKIGKGVDDIKKNTGDTADNTSKEEDYSYLRKLAERQAIQRYTLTDLKVDMTNNNTISNNMDLNKVIGEIAKQLANAVVNNAEDAGLIYR